MQAVRQCSACARRAAGGLLRNQAEISLLQTGKNLFRRGVPCNRFLSVSQSRKLGAHEEDNLTNTTNVDSTFKQQVENLSQDSLIRRAASVVTDSSSTFLSQTTLALTEALKVYSRAVHSRITVQRQYLASLRKLTAAEDETLRQLINGWRAEASERLEECKRYESTWITAVNLCKIAAETADTSGAEKASLSLRTLIQAAESQVGEARKMSAAADKKLAETKVEEIQRMAEYAASQDKSDEHDIHEAYLRED